METRNEFYKKMNAQAQEAYNEVEAMRPHTDKFRYFMDHPNNKEYPHFTDENLEFLAKEDLPTLMAVYPDDAELYMSW